VVMSESIRPSRTVVHVFGAMDTGGAEIRTMELMTALAARGVTGRYVTLSGNRGLLADEIEARGGTVSPLPLSASFPLRFLVLLRRLRVDVVDSHVATFSGAILAIAWLAGVPVRIAHFRSDGDGHGHSVRRRVQRTVMRFLVSLFATDIIGVAPGTLALGYSRSWSADPRCRIIPNGVSTARLRDESDLVIRDLVDLGPDAVLCLHVGRASPEKNRQAIPAIIAELRRTGIDAHAVLIGPRAASDDALVLHRAQEHGVAGTVHLLGADPHIGGLLRQVDVLLLPSHREGLPGVVIEAAALGVPVVATALPGVEFIASRLPSILTMPSSATAAEWADVVRSAISGGEQDREPSDALQEFERSEFCLAKSVEAHAQLYAGLKG